MEEAAMIFVDTGAFIARHHASDEWHDAAIKAWKKLTPRPLYTSSLILGETARLLRRYLSTTQVISFLEDCYASPTLHILRNETDDDRQALSLMRKYADQDVSFVDAVSFVLMKRYKIATAFGFDRHFEMAGFELWPGLFRKR